MVEQQTLKALNELAAAGAKEKHDANAFDEGYARGGLFLPELLISLGRREGHDAMLRGEIADVHFLGSVIRVRVGVGGSTVSLDTFNNSSTPPPKVGERAEISFASEDILVLH